MKSLSMRSVCLLLLITLVMGAFSLTACQKSDPLAENGISSVTVNAAKQTVTVHVTLNTSTLEAHAGQELCLYLLAPDQAISNIDPDSPVKTAKAKGEVRFTLPLSEGEDNRLYAGYAVGFSDGTLLSASPAYVTNPAALSSDKGVFPWSASSKALLMDSSAHATALHTMHTAVSVSWRELTAGEDSFAFFGKTYRYSEPYLRALDKLIADSCGGGAQVSLILSGDALSDHAYNAALLELLTSRYSGGEKGKVTALIINGGSSPSDASRLFRYAYLALRSRVANGRVYVQSNAQTLTDAKIYFTDLASSIAKNGGGEWGAAVTPSCKLDTLSVTADNGDLLTFPALDSFSDSLFSKTLAPAWLAVTGVAFSAADQDKQAAALAYAYGCSAAAGASLFCYDSHYSIADGLCDENGEERPACRLFARLERGLTDSDRAACASYFGDGSLNMLSYRPVEVAVSGNASAGSLGLTENYLFDFSGGSTHGFSGLGSVTAPVTKVSATYNAPVLYTWLDAATAPSGVRTVMPKASALSGGVSVSVRLLTQLPAEAEGCILTLRLEGQTQSGGLLCYESQITASNGVWQTVTFQISNFVADADPNAPCVLTLTAAPQQPVDGEYVLWVRDLGIRRPESDPGILLPAAIILAGAAVGFMGVLILFHVSSSKKKSRPRRH